MTTQNGTKKATQVMLDIMDKQLVDYTINEPSDKPISFVMCKEGVVEVRKTLVGQFARLHTKIGQAEENLIFKCMKIDATQLKSAAEIPKFRMDLPKIPLNFLHKIVQFFKVVYIKQQTEAAALIRWNLEKKEYYIEIPGGPKDKYQDLSGGGVQYKPNPLDNNPIVMDLHSHHTMSPFFSSTDDGDEQSTQLYGVVGHIEHSQAAVNIRVRMRGTDLLTDVPIEDIFEKDSNFDPTWMDNIRKAPLVAVKSPDELWPDRGSWKRGSRRSRKTNRYPDGFPDNWEDRLDDYANREEAPTLKDIMEHEQDISGYSRDTPPMTGNADWKGLDDPNISSVFDDVWEVVEKELYDRPEIFCSQEAIMELRDFLFQQIATASADDIAKDATTNEEPEVI